MSHAWKLIAATFANLERRDIRQYNYTDRGLGHILTFPNYITRIPENIVPKIMLDAQVMRKNAVERQERHLGD